MEAAEARCEKLREPASAQPRTSEIRASGSGASKRHPAQLGEGDLLWNVQRAGFRGVSESGRFELMRPELTS